MSEGKSDAKENTIVSFVRETILSRLSEASKTGRLMLFPMWGEFTWDPKESHMWCGLSNANGFSLREAKGDKHDCPCPSFAFFRTAMLQLDGMMIDDRYKINIKGTCLRAPQRTDRYGDITSPSITMPCCGTIVTDFDALVSDICPARQCRWADWFAVNFTLERS